MSKPKLTIEFYDTKGVHLRSVPARASLHGHWSASTYLFKYGYIERCVDGAIVGGQEPCALPWKVA